MVTSILNQLGTWASWGKEASGAFFGQAYTLCGTANTNVGQLACNILAAGAKAVADATYGVALGAVKACGQKVANVGLQIAIPQISKLIKDKVGKINLHALLVKPPEALDRVEEIIIKLISTGVFDRFFSNFQFVKLPFWQKRFSLLKNRFDDFIGRQIKNENELALHYSDLADKEKEEILFKKKTILNVLVNEFKNLNKIENIEYLCNNLLLSLSKSSKILTNPYFDPEMKIEAFENLLIATISGHDYDTENFKDVAVKNIQKNLTEIVKSRADSISNSIVDSIYHDEEEELKKFENKTSFSNFEKIKLKIEKGKLKIKKQWVHLEVSFVSFVIDLLCGRTLLLKSVDNIVGDAIGLALKPLAHVQEEGIAVEIEEEDQGLKLQLPGSIKLNLSKEEADIVHKFLPSYLKIVTLYLLDQLSTSLARTLEDQTPLPSQANVTVKESDEESDDSEYFDCETPVFSGVSDKDSEYFDCETSVFSGVSDKDSEYFDCEIPVFSGLSDKDKLQTDDEKSDLQKNWDELTNQLLSFVENFRTFDQKEELLTYASTKSRLGKFINLGVNGVATNIVPSALRTLVKKINIKKDILEPLSQGLEIALQSHSNPR